MKSNLHCLSSKLGSYCSCSCIKVVCLGKSFHRLIPCIYRCLIFNFKSLWFQFCYFMCLSIMGCLTLSFLKPRASSSPPEYLDMFFTSVSATTVSSMSTVEMEDFSNNQLVVLTILMFLGGEVFTCFLELQVEKSKLMTERNKKERNTNSVVHDDPQLELGELESNGSYVTVNENVIRSITHYSSSTSDHEDLKYNSVKYLGNVLLGYLSAFLGGGSILVYMYMKFVPSASEVLKSKGIDPLTFSVFSIVSSFVNCGYIPTNENMVVFRKNSGLILLIIPQVLFGNTLFPVCLRFVLWVLGRFSTKEELHYMLKVTSKDEIIRYPAKEILISTINSLYFLATVLVFILVQFILFCSLEWNSEGLHGMNSYQKFVGALFQTVNSRHAGENIIDLSIISPAILVVFVVMMYLPPYTSFLPLITDEQQSMTGSFDRKMKQKPRRTIDNLLFSQLPYLVIFITIICIIERKKLKDDPLNYSVFNITIEVISAYGNVGFTTGYSCKRQLNPNNQCKDMMYGFVGRWSNGGKIMLVMVMVFGRLKKFNLKGGRAWKSNCLEKGSSIVS
ncbi:sodium transporter HKT1-like [Papaver somniferum]|uniref:sodium transporter HKT1-like n=1 Tax=Papaver somniferum TaxID=3469 RepID=UPI000E6FD00C|nr:sodium transporter HKT1-like [Papaver somniferum]